ncbi:hypothetical protein D3C74_297410 [compost metagenome]
MVLRRRALVRAVPALDRDRVGLGPVGADEVVTQRVVRRRRLARREVVERPRLVVGVVLDDAVLVGRPRRVERHLQVLVVDRDRVEGELHVRPDRQLTDLVGRVGQAHVPDLDVVVQRDEDRLLGVDALVPGLERRVAQAVARGPAARPARGVQRRTVLRQRLAHRLPRHRPEVAVGLVAQVHVVPRAVERDAVLAEPRDAAGLRRLVVRVAAAVVREHGAEVLGAQVVRPRDGDVWALDDVLVASGVRSGRSASSGRFLSVRWGGR